MATSGENVDTHGTSTRVTHRTVTTVAVAVHIHNFVKCAQDRFAVWTGDCCKQNTVTHTKVRRDSPVAGGGVDEGDGVGDSDALVDSVAAADSGTHTITKKHRKNMVHNGSQQGTKGKQPGNPLGKQQPHLSPRLWDCLGRIAPFHRNILKQAHVFHENTPD
jgi:hypothetical protein